VTEVNNWEQVARGFTYKPGWSVEYLYDIDFDQHYVIVDARVPDVYRPEKLISVVRKNAVRPDESEEYMKEYIRRMIQDIELHEVDEFLTYRGAREWDPHKDEVDL